LKECGWVKRREGEKERKIVEREEKGEEGPFENRDGCDNDGGG
jgi:hypothetical protein